MTAHMNNAKLGLLLPAFLNPATAAAVGIGLGLLWLLRDDEEQREATVDAETIRQAKPAVKTVAQPLPAVEVLPDEIVLGVTGAAPAPISETDQKEMDLSRFCAAPSAHLSHFPFESDGAFPTQC